ncbi:copper transporter ATPase [Spiroplasma syrphidicola EA-1]|uniref:Copper transporter ATPase n=1 Tax=Spiroplasma syrphidicola EA-1 TaxID=1276229 RepID=R4U6D6_9MOLU|nr:cation-translocating P-type ATPase [Spiroplasma syrphidicola]AGM26143.1 copper transporter ATPase [Spiroplasma syrphidicola EA-1]
MANQQKRKWSKRQIRNTYELVLAICCDLPLLLAMIPGLNVLHNQWLQLGLTTVIMFYCGRNYYLNMYREIFKWHSIGMNTLIGIGTLIAYGYSIYIIASASAYMLLFEVAGTIITMMLIGNLINTSVQQKVTVGIKDVVSLQAQSANLVDENNNITVVNTRLVKLNNLLLVKKGEQVPVDGVITLGVSYLNEAMLTGESAIVTKKVGDHVIGGTINMGEPFYFKAQKVGADTVLANILQKVDEIQSQKPRMQQIADRIAKWFTPFILLIALATFLAQYFYFNPANLPKGINIAITVIVISCPCALGLATPLAVAVGFGKAIKEGIIFNNTSAFEKINKIDAIAFDKTGTITTGVLTVEKIIGSVENYRFIYQLEKLSAHPIAKSIIAFFGEKSFPDLKFTNFTEQPGKGLTGEYQNKEYQLLEYSHAVEMQYPNIVKNEVALLKHPNATLVALTINKTITNIIILTDQIRSDAQVTISKFKKQGIELHMISGDNLTSVKITADALGIPNYHGQVDPMLKAQIVKTIQDSGKVTAYVGDGINDLVALQQADFAIAMGEENAGAVNGSDITIIRPSIFNIYKAFVLTKLTRKIIWTNFFWAFSYNLITIPLAMVGIIPPILGAVVMGFSQLVVLLNSLAFNQIKLKFK